MSKPELKPGTQCAYSTCANEATRMIQSNEHEWAPICDEEHLLPYPLEAKLDHIPPDRLEEFKKEWEKLISQPGIDFPLVEGFDIPGPSSGEPIDQIFKKLDGATFPPPGLKMEPGYDGKGKLVEWSLVSVRPESDIPVSNIIVIDDLIPGDEKGETCNREGCTGIIGEYEKDGCCSCHINPPCSFCTEDNRYCPECEWYAKDGPVPELSEEAKQYYLNLMNEVDTRKEELQKKRRGEIPVNEIDYQIIPHTHASQICEGVYPKDTKKEEVRQKVRGTFGGRFTEFGSGRFTFIAYTD